MATNPSSPSAPTRRKRERGASQRFHTRMALIQAAREVFEADGFVKARVSDIVKAAGVAQGTFYIYFDSKEHIFREVASAVLGETLTTGPRRRTGGDRQASVDPQRILESIETSNRAYLMAYARNATMMMLIEQVATLSEELMHVRHERFLAFVSRTERSLLRMKRAGVADPDLDVHHTALALTGMASRMAFFAFVQHEEFDLEAVVKVMTTTWARAINLDHHLAASELDRQPAADA